MGSMSPEYQSAYYLKNKKRLQIYKKGYYALNKKDYFRRAKETKEKLKVEEKK